MCWNEARSEKVVQSDLGHTTCDSILLCHSKVNELIVTDRCQYLISRVSELENAWNAVTVRIELCLTSR